MPGVIATGRNDIQSFLKQSYPDISVKVEQTQRLFRSQASTYISSQLFKCLLFGRENIHSRIFGTYPYILVIIFNDLSYPFTADRFFTTQRYIPGEFQYRTGEIINTSGIGSYPDSPFPILINLPDLIVRKRITAHRIVVYPENLSFFFIDNVDTILRTDP